MKTTFQSLCHGYPNEFFRYFNLCNALEFEENPAYDDLIALFAGLLKRLGLRNDNHFDWELVRGRQNNDSIPH